MRLRRNSVHTILRLPHVWESRLTNLYTAPPLHLFRSLLRQCTYLPDPNSRNFFHKHIVSRFRAYCPRPYNDPRQSFKKTKVVIKRRPKLLKTGRKALRFLCRANHGHFEHLSRVLALTYGRIGPRRHELLKDLKTPDSPVGGVELKEVLERLSEPANQNVPQPSRKLLALIKSQSQRKETSYGRTSIKRTSPQIPETNVWGRSMPVKRVRNIRRRWYADVLDRVRPPLPEDEWHILRKMAIGEISFHGSVARRGPGDGGDIGLEMFRTGKGQLSRPHDLSPRYMRRLWAKISWQCPMMKRNESKVSGWDVIWPELKKATEVSLRSDLGLLVDSAGMFEGVDDDGKIRTTGF